MAIRVIAQRRVLKIGKNPGAKKFVMRPELYTSLTEKTGVIKAAWDAAGEVIRTWATEGHSVPLPGLGTMRFGVRSKAVEDLEDVKTGLITTRRIVFTPSVDVKDELKSTSIQITCLDEDGNVLKRVTSGDSGDATPRTAQVAVAEAAQAAEVATAVATLAVAATEVMTSTRIRALGASAPTLT